MKKIYVLEVNGNYENGKFEVAGVYSTIELAKKAATKFSGRYFTFIKEWDVDANAKYPSYY